MLNDKELKSLQELLDDFFYSNTVIRVVKKNYSEYLQYIQICYLDVDGSVRCLDMPLFATGTKYTGLETDRRYSLDNLGLTDSRTSRRSGKEALQLLCDNFFEDNTLLSFEKLHLQNGSYLVVEYYEIDDVTAPVDIEFPLMPADRFDDMSSGVYIPEELGITRKNPADTKQRMIRQYYCDGYRTDELCQMFKENRCEIELILQGGY